MKDDLNNWPGNTICQKKIFLTLVRQILGNQYRHAERFLYLHTKFVQLSMGETAYSEWLMGDGDNIIIVLDGLVSGYLISDSGQRCDTWIGDYQGVFVYDIPGQVSEPVNLEAIKPALVMLISQNELEMGCRSFPVLEMLFTRLIFPNAIRDLNRYILIGKLGSRLARLGYFQKIYPKVWDRVPARIYHTYAQRRFL